MIPRTTIKFDKEQVKAINRYVSKYDWIFQNESHFVRCAVNYFCRSIEKGKFKLEPFETD